MYEDSVDYMLGGTLTLKNGLIDKYYFEDGYCKMEKRSDNSKETIRYYYYDQDHLGNIRQVTEVDGSPKGKVVQTNNYYPFGMLFCDGTKNYLDQKHKYNGKEYDKMHGLNTYDYGARQYNPVTARWDRVDPLCEKYYSISPYAYCANNPVNWIDPDGMDWYQKEGENGAMQYEWQEGSEQRDGWINIGANHTIINGNIKINYEQNEMVSLEFTTSAIFMPQGNDATGCKRYSDKMVKSSGATPSLGRNGEILMAIPNGNGVAIRPSNTVDEGLSRLTDYISSGQAVTVGVDYKPDKGTNTDKMTDHFVAVVGMCENYKEGTTTFRFFDPGSSRNGASPSNVMKMQNGFLQGKLAFGNLKFKVTTIRKNL